MLEIERKFLVLSKKYRNKAHKVSTISQGYISKDPKRTVRVRTKDGIGFINIKGPSSKSGVSRFEWEKEITIEEAKLLMALCEHQPITKKRYLVKEGIHLFEVDEFEGPNFGLVIAEIELTSEEEYFRKPNWIGEEVSGKKQYFNSQLSSHPYCDW